MVASKKDGWRNNRNHRKKTYSKSWAFSSGLSGYSEEKEYYIWGRQPVLEALRAGIHLKKIILQQNSRGEAVAEIVQLADEKKIVLELSNREGIEVIIPGENHQGVVALAPPFRYYSLQELLKKVLEKEKAPFLLLLDHIQDPYNLGSLLRTAHCFNAGGVVIPRDRACGVTPVAFKASAGAAAYVPVARVVNLAREVDVLKKEGFWIMGAEIEGEMPFYKADFSLPLVLVLGSEGKGLSRLVKERCDFLLNIPSSGAIPSLNVAVAAGIIIFEIFRQRRLR